MICTPIFHKSASLRNAFYRTTRDFTNIHKNAKFHTSSLLGKMRRTRDEKKAKNIIKFKPKSKQPLVQLWKGVTIVDIAMRMERTIDDVLESVSLLENPRLYHNIHTEIYDIQVVRAIAKNLGCLVDVVKNPAEITEESKTFIDISKRPPPDAKELVKRPPVVTIMGHVDHGKTTLLDALRHTSVVSQEHGGITQHIGAFTVNLPEGQITFLDTPGHAAFRMMRARGASVTDMVVLVVAADDGIMEQTLESVRFAREANVPIIVAINKIDKIKSDVDAVRQNLLSCGLQVEDLGGDVQAIPISALKKMNLDQLTEAILTQAEIMGVGGDLTGLVEGVVIEASMDFRKGKISTVLIQRGTLKKGDILVSGISWTKIRAMVDEKGQKLAEVTPGMPVQVAGWQTCPVAGDIILEVESERKAKEIVKYREKKRLEEKGEHDHVIIQKKAAIHREKYQKERQARLMRGRYRKERNYFREKEYIENTDPCLAFVLKGDVHGSVEAILDVVGTYKSHDACRLDLVHSGVGNVTENDLVLAESFDGMIYCFNVTVPPEIMTLASEQGILIKSFHVIYHLIDDMKSEISSRLPLVREEDVLGEAIVLQEFKINDKKKKLPVAGCKCTKGMLKRGSHCKIIRSEAVIYDGPIQSLKHEKSDVDSVKKDVECGLMVENHEIYFLPGDTITCYSPKNVSQVTDWEPGF